MFCAFLLSGFCQRAEFVDIWVYLETIDGVAAQSTIMVGESGHLRMNSRDASGRII